MHTPALLATLAAAMLLAAPSAHALFKVVGPDGKVTYTDRVPNANEGKIVPVDSTTGRASDPALPFALRQVVARFPVTLYTAANCAEACGLGRSLLTKRGVPFIERTAETDEEREAWVRLVGGLEAPVLKLSVAGYPRQSLLPVNYQAPPAVPLIARQPAAPKSAPQAPAAPAADPDSNPAGIRF
jgi:hypothetical protein